MVTRCSVLTPLLTPPVTPSTPLPPSPGHCAIHILQQDTWKASGWCFEIFLKLHAVNGQFLFVRLFTSWAIKFVWINSYYCFFFRNVLRLRAGHGVKARDALEESSSVALSINSYFSSGYLKYFQPLSVSLSLTHSPSLGLLTRFSAAWLPGLPSSGQHRYCMVPSVQGTCLTWVLQCKPVSGRLG